MDLGPPVFSSFRGASFPPALIERFGLASPFTELPETLRILRPCNKTCKGDVPLSRVSERVIDHRCQWKHTTEVRAEGTDHAQRQEDENWP